MNPINYSLAVNQEISIDGSDRWDLYYRLQELDIPCQCSSHRPLTVQISNPNHLLQVWCVIRRMNASRKEMIQLLKNNWQVRFHN
ncbi:Asr1405/Asl0597 family protein [Pseudanabaena sp. 'Roaring Creek']|uniref:Asr1405/Asl0597 family protein n=1 Tax=Pseudanabaena sp. 'Roaring Creek' TaxID=1681830 RepID=UPI00092EECB3|nr:Asr1405/Asl0597 family protein [Pseudanabaena sp. 'Roaring Creek']